MSCPVELRLNGNSQLWARHAGDHALTGVSSKRQAHSLLPAMIHTRINTVPLSHAIASEGLIMVGYILIAVLIVGIITVHQMRAADESHAKNSTSSDYSMHMDADPQVRHSIISGFEILRDSAPVEVAAAPQKDVPENAKWVLNKPGQMYHRIYSVDTKWIGTLCGRSFYRRQVYGFVEEEDVEYGRCTQCSTVLLNRWLKYPFGIG